MRASRVIVLCVICALALTGCAKKSKTFTTGQLGTFMLNQNDVPERLKFVTDASGEQTIDDIVSSDEERAKLTSLNFQSAYQSTFVNDSAAAALSNDQPAPNDAEFAGSFVILFKTADEAHQALAYETQRDRRTGQNIQLISGPKLGDETITETGQTDTLPFPGDLIYWRIGNALFVVVAAGNESALDISIGNATKWATIVNNRANR
jgi:hypothetical protein